MKFENTKVYNIRDALRGMRNPKESWKKNDTEIIGVRSTDIGENYIKLGYKYTGNKLTLINTNETIEEMVKIGENDLTLAQSLIKAGSVHRKFMRQIFVSVDITAPLYWWKEYATYKVGTVENSTSTMHKLASTPITKDHFEMDDYNKDIENDDYWNYIIDKCENLRVKYLVTKNKKYWKELIRRIPDSWLQTRTCTLNYETLLNICAPDCRLNHKLNEWSGKDDETLTNFISWVRTLPYANELLFIKKTPVITKEIVEKILSLAHCDSNIDIDTILKEINQ